MTYIPPVNGGRINATISGNTAGVGALMSTGTVTLAGGNNITLSQNGNAVTISGANAAAGSNTLGMSNLGNTLGTSGVISGSQLRFAFAGGNNITLSQSLNGSSGTITISAANQTVQTQNMVSVNGSTGNVSFANGNNVTFGVNASTITASASFNQSVQTQNAHNVTLSGNTAGVMAQVSSGTLTLAGGNNITLSQNGNAVTISGGAGGGGAFSAGMSNLGNTSGTTGLATNQFVLVGGDNITLSQSTAAGGNTISISAGAGGGSANPIISFYQNLVPQNSAQPYTTLAITFRTMLVQPLSPVEGFGFPGDITVSTFMMQMSGSQTATSATSAWSSSFSSSLSVGIYLMTNSSQLTLVNSASTSWSAAANTQNSTNWAGPRFLTIHSSQWSSEPVLSYGRRYWYGVLHNSSNFSNMGPSWMGQYIGASTQRSGSVGVSQVINTSRGMVPFLGIYATSLTSMPVSVGNSQINKVHALAGFAPAVILNATISEF